MANSYILAPDLDAPFQRVAETVNPDLIDNEATVVIVWRTAPIRNRQKLEVAKASIVSGLKAFLASVQRNSAENFALKAVEGDGRFVVVEVWQHGWNFLSNEEKDFAFANVATSIGAELVERNGHAALSLKMLAPEVSHFVTAAKAFPKGEKSLAEKLATAKANYDDERKRSAAAERLRDDGEDDGREVAETIEDLA